MKALLPKSNSRLQISEIELPSPGPEDVLIKVKASGVNRADLLQKAGKYPPPPGASDVIGLEVAGVIDRVGDKVQGLNQGDRVMALLAGGGYAEYVTVQAGSVMPLPENLSFEEGAAIPETFLTAYQALHWLGEMKAEENVLVHAGASGVSTSAIQLINKVGAKAFVTAGSQEKIDFCKSLGATDGVNYKTTDDMANDILTCTGGRGMDIILDFIGAPYARANSEVIAVDGRWILLAFMGGVTAELDLSKVLMKRIQMKGSTLRARAAYYKAKLVKQFSNQYLVDFTSGELKPIIDSVFDWCKVEESHAHMQDNRNKGKIILNGM